MTRSMDFIERSQTDVNVMAYELVDYVNDYTSLKALWRVGGDLELLKRLIAAGFPVIAEKGIYQTLPPETDHAVGRSLCLHHRVR